MHKLIKTSSIFIVLATLLFSFNAHALRCDMTNTNEMCPTDYCPSADAPHSCQTLTNDAECQDYLRTNTGPTTTKERCQELKDQCDSVTENTQCMCNLCEPEDNTQQLGETIQTTQVLSEGGNTDCHPAKFMAWFDKCLFCHLFKTVYNAASAIAKHAYGKFADPVANIMVVAAAIWIALKTLPLVSSLKNRDGAEYIMDLLKQMLLIFVIIAFLKTGGMGFFTYIMEPIFNTGFALSKTLLDTGSPCQDDYGILMDGGLPASMGNSVVCVIEQIQRSVSQVLSLGLTSICVACFIENIKPIPVLFPDLSYLLTGLLLMLGGMMLLIVFPFIVLDSILQLAVAAALLPLAMGCFAFKATKKYWKTVWDTFMAAIFNFVFLCLVMMICVKTIDSVMADTMIQSLAQKQDYDQLLTTIGWESTLFIKILFLFVLSKVMLEEVNSFASKFSGGGFKMNMSKKAGGVLASGMLNMGKKTLLKGAKAGVKKAGKEISKGWSNMRTQQRANAARNEFAWLNKQTPQKQQSTASSVSSPKLNSLNAEKSRLETQIANLAKSGAGSKAMQNAQTRLKTVNQKINKERNKLKPSQQNVTGGGTIIKTQTKDSTITYEKKEDGTIIKTEVKQGQTITTTIGTDAQGRSTINVLKEDTRKKEKGEALVAEYKDLVKEGKAQAITNEDGSTTYMRTDKAYEGITIDKDGNIQKHKDGWLHGKRDEKMNTGVSTKTTSRSHNQISRQSTNSRGEVVYEDTKYKDDILNSDGTLKASTLKKLEKGQKELEERLKIETNEDIKKNLEKEIAKEKEKNGKLIAEAVIANTISSSYFRSDKVGQVNQNINVNDKGVITLTSTDVNGKQTVVKVNAKLDIAPKVELEKENADGSKVSLKTDGLVQKKSITTEDGKVITRYSLSNFKDLKGITDPEKAKRELKKLLDEESSMEPEEKEKAIEYLTDLIVNKQKFSAIDAFK